MDSIPSFHNMKPLDPDQENRNQDNDDDETEGMDEMFEGQGPYSEEFSVDELCQPAGSAVWKPGFVDDEETQTREIGDNIRVRDTDLRHHRRDSFPHARHPLKPSHHHRKNRKKGHRHDDDEEDKEKEETEKKVEEKGKHSGVSIEIGDPDLDEGWSIKPIKGDKAETKPPPSSPEIYRPRKGSTDDELFETSPLITSKIAALRSCIRSETDTAGSEDEAANALARKGRVQFDIAKISEYSMMDDDTGQDDHSSDAAESEQEQRPKPHKKRRSSRRKQEFEDPSWRRRTGNEKRKPNDHFSYTTTDDEARQLKEHALSQISTHRFENKSVPRRQTLRAKSSMSSFFHPSQSSETPSKQDKIQIIKKTFDHNPHEVFVELSELRQTPVGGLEWKETARWIKYEEDVEGADNRWGKPHIAFLNFNALFSLRKGLERGSILLDLDEQDLPSIATRVVDLMVACDQIPPDQRDAVIRILLLRHKHIKESQNAFRRMASSRSRLHLASASEEGLPTSRSTTSLDGRTGSKKPLANIFHASTYSNFAHRASIDDNALTNNNVTKPSSRRGSCVVDVESDTETKEKRKMNIDLMKKLPEGAEATAVLVGAVDFLMQPTIAFVRLAEGVVMENVIEVPIPIRFLFVLLGPYYGEMDYHEVGRAISTLMSDKNFHEVAYKAHSRGQLLAAINEFLNASIVFPPSEWKHKDLVPLEEIHAKTQEMRRKKEDLKAKKKMAQTTEAEAEAAAAIAIASGEGGDKKPPPRDPLVRRGRLFYGLVQDVKIRYSQYLSDFKDGLSPQVLSACIFIFFAALSPAITFGGMYSDLTDRYIGVGETLLVSSINGMIFALFAAQPLLIIGATGPLMIFDMSLLQFCDSMELDFLSIRVWVGIWILLFGLLVAAFEAVSIVKKFTRFTEEIFSTLVCIIFIYGAFEKLAVIFKKHPLTSLSSYGVASSCFKNMSVKNGNLTHLDENDEEIDPEYVDDIDDDDDEGESDSSLHGLLSNETLLNATNAEGNGSGSEGGVMLENQPNTALLSAFLMIGTFLIAWKLKKFRNSKFLGRSVRRALGDFGVPLAIFMMVLIDFLIHDTYTDKLSMPKGLKPSNSEVRGWLINPLGVVDDLPIWSMVAAGPAALLLFVLIFLEENICQLILIKPERCMKKGSGFHLDIVLSCFINTVAGFLGAPFMGPACVRTIAHMSSLTIMSSNVAPGESPKIVGCYEQRVSAVAVSILIGLSVMLYAILNLVPTAVLLGIFLYMGVSATAGIQLIERCVLLFMPIKHHPNVPYVKKVRTRKMHAFTLVQVLMLIILWIVKQSPAALAIPFVLLCLIPLRLYLLPFLFTPMELIALDGAEQAALMEAHEDERDFYEAAHDLGTQIESKEHET